MGSRARYFSLSYIPSMIWLVDIRENVVRQLRATCRGQPEEPAALALAALSASEGFAVTGAKPTPIRNRAGG